MHTQEVPETAPSGDAPGRSPVPPRRRHAPVSSQRAAHATASIVSPAWAAASRAAAATFAQRVAPSPPRWGHSVASAVQHAMPPRWPSASASSRAVGERAAAAASARAHCDRAASAQFGAVHTESAVSQCS